MALIVPPFARAITAFKHDDDTQSFVFYPVLEQAELRLKPEQFFFVIFSLHLLVLHIPAEAAVYDRPQSKFNTANLHRPRDFCLWEKVARSDG
jgi:hypothetical protein